MEIKRDTRQQNRKNKNSNFVKKFRDFSAHVLLAFVIITRILNVILSSLVNNLLKTIKNYMLSTRLSLRIEAKLLMLFICKSIKRARNFNLKWKRYKKIKKNSFYFCELWPRSVIIILCIKPTFCLIFWMAKGDGVERRIITVCPWKGKPAISLNESPVLICYNYPWLQSSFNGVAFRE